MADRPRSLREEIERRLLENDGEVPTGSLGRWARTAVAGLRGGRLAWRHRDGQELPADLESLAKLAGSVGQLKGIAMKAGQLMSYFDLPVPPEVRSALEALQTHSPPMSFERVSEIVRQELGERADELLAKMEPAPVAAASIGQVHRARLDEAPVAVKVQYPDIDKAIAADFGPAAAGSGFMSLLMPGANVSGMIKDARTAFLDECDYRREAAFQERFAHIYRDHATVRIPAVHPDHVSQRVLTTTWVDGARFDAYLAQNPSQAARDRAGEALFEFYVGTMFSHGLHNWDPHPGNYLFLADGGLAMLDYGAVREMDPGFVAKLAALTRAVQARSDEALRRALADLGMRPDKKGADDLEVARNLMHMFYGPMVRDEVLAVQPGEARPVRSLVQDKKDLLKLSLPAELLFIFRTRFGLLSVLSKLGARANWYRLERSFLSD